MGTETDADWRWVLAIPTPQILGELSRRWLGGKPRWDILEGVPEQTLIREIIRRHGKESSELS